MRTFVAVIRAFLVQTFTTTFKKGYENYDGGYSRISYNVDNEAMHGLPT